MAPFDPPPEPQPATDALGFAPTRIVRARKSRRGGVIRFYRVWMKPANLTFPPQERELLGAERAEAFVNFTRQRGRQGAEVRLAVGTNGTQGVCPQNGSHPATGGGDSFTASAPHVCPPFLIEARAVELKNLQLLPEPWERKTVEHIQEIGAAMMEQLLGGEKDFHTDADEELPRGGPLRAIGNPPEQENDGQQWCAMCGQWGDHRSGTCPELEHLREVARPS